MSGPKTSNYEILAERKRLLREQSERELKTRQEKIKIAQTTAKLLRLKSDINIPIEKLSAITNRAAYANAYISKLKDIQDSVSKVLSDNSAVAGRQLESLAESFGILDGTYNHMYAVYCDVLSDADDLLAQEKESINADIDNGFIYLFNNNEISGIEDVLYELKVLKTSHELSDDIRQEIQSAIEKLVTIESADFLKNYRAMSVAPLVKKSEQYIKAYRENFSEYEQLVTEYAALCELLAVEPDEFEFSLETMALLKNKNEELRELQIKYAEQNYISDTVDRVMSEMGYNVLGYKDVQKNSGKRFRSELYRFCEGTAVNVTYDSEGRITMELGGLDNIDRLPNDTESSKLREQMSDFCRDFSAIEERLLEKGVAVSRRVSMLPPDSEYAQIINTEEYTINEQINRFSAKKDIQNGAHKTMRNE